MAAVSGIDLNLLVVLDALLEERHVTRAGTRLSLSQSTMSGALARLRAITPAGCDARIDLTITDEGPMAQALVVISAVPRADA